MMNMPGGDRTGPQGQGPRTGRGLGYCSGYDHPGYAKNTYSRGCGFFRRQGRGFGRGRGFRYHVFDIPIYPSYYPSEPYPRPDAEEEKTFLQQAIRDLENEIKNLKDRLSQLDKEQNKTP
jgi:hypothetical protein